MLTGNKTLLESKNLIKTADGGNHVMIKRLGGLIIRTYGVSDQSEIANKGLEAEEGEVSRAPRWSGVEWRSEKANMAKRSRTIAARVASCSLEALLGWIQSGRRVTDIKNLGSKSYSRPGNQPHSGRDGLHQNNRPAIISAEPSGDPSGKDAAFKKGLTLGQAEVKNDAQKPSVSREAATHQRPREDEMMVMSADWEAEQGNEYGDPTNVIVFGARTSPIQASGSISRQFKSRAQRHAR
ncbi:hypothetical protein QA648_35970 (plasmid) [Rhizobium sp. CB3171]|uniref:hypothetical protein n=1 Tax=Rhizobium sp. CB3171 TaxID=3039157 RepID=UPI0024B05284|nr:hypothetical protein [Rhizobium sp. CB3171]WFU07299.1 hypothetical protein QA648_35970 [Rhizobium sp. CB3171]